MRRSGTGSGGGVGMNKNVRVGVRAGPASTNVMSPAGVSALGIAKARTVEPIKTGTAAQVPLGNQVATNVGRGGPGTGRTLYGQSGLQGQHGPANPGNPRPVPQSHPLSEFGPNKTRG